MKPLVSIVMPAYNAAPHITAAINSILEHQSQPLELIVVNDGSTDETVSLVPQADERIVLLHQSHQGISAALNTGIRAARGEWLTFLDADDLWVAGRLEKEFAAFEAQPDLAIVFAHMQNFYSPETDDVYRARIYCEPNPMPGIWYHTMLMRRTEFLRVGLLETRWAFGNFMEWLERANALGMTHTVLPDVLLLRRLHLNNSGLRDLSTRKDYARVLKTLLDRKRQKSAAANP